jgi:hypothetical protein
MRRGFMFREQGGHALPVGQVERVVQVFRMRLQPLQPRVLQRRVVVAVQIVDPDHRLPARQQALRRVEADEAGRAGDEDGSASHG